MQRRLPSKALRSTLIRKRGAHLAPKRRSPPAFRAKGVSREKRKLRTERRAHRNVHKAFPFHTHGRLRANSDRPRHSSECLAANSSSPCSSNHGEPVRQAPTSHPIAPKQLRRSAFHAETARPPHPDAKRLRDPRARAGRKPLSARPAGGRARASGHPAREARRASPRLAPAGGAPLHDDAARQLDRALWEALVSLDGLDPRQVREDRYQRFRRLGSYVA